MIDVPNWAHEILQAFESRLKGDEIFIKECPHCKNDRWNLQVSISKCVFNCWACNYGKGISVYHFLREHNLEFETEELKRTDYEKPVNEIVLPDSYSLHNAPSRLAQEAKKYLLGRDVHDTDILDWKIRIGTGKDKDKLQFDYFGWLIFPLYGLNGLEYFISANFLDNKRYKLPSTTKDKFTPKKRGSNEIVLVEGIYDGTTTWKYTDYDVFVISGKFLGSKQIELLKNSGYDRVYVCLDGDAYKDAIELANILFTAGIPIALTELPVGKDPNDVGKYINIYIEESIDFTKTTMSKLKRKLLYEQY